MTRIDMYSEHLKGYYLSDVIKGSGCKHCNYRGWTVTTYRDEVRDEEIFWTCTFCIPDELREHLRKKYRAEDV